ncbi:MAG TPA: hypothetical protein VNF49_14025 [Candidatus Binataceae bacterium]|nr:hypothetical protein [Candidatus Binataceae bacterium]
MRNYLTLLYDRLRTRRAQAMAEYAAITGVILVVAYSVFLIVGGVVNTLMQGAAAAF